MPDPFPTVRCPVCGARTTSMNGEACCARCDLDLLLRGHDIRRDGTSLYTLARLLLLG